MGCRLRGLVCASLFTTLYLGGCAPNHEHVHGHDTITSEAMVVPPSGKRVSLALDYLAQEAHQAVMRDHLKAVPGNYSGFI